MEFNNHKAIYRQIADHICEQVLTKQWHAGERIPSVRELSVELEVNPNTVMRAYEYLETNEIIANRRGIGFSLTNNAVNKAIVFQKEIFMSETMPILFKNIYLLNISFQELEIKYKKFCAKQSAN